MLWNDTILYNHVVWPTCLKSLYRTRLCHHRQEKTPSCQSTGLISDKYGGGEIGLFSEVYREVRGSIAHLVYVQHNYDN